MAVFGGFWRDLAVLARRFLRAPGMGDVRNAQLRTTDSETTDGEAGPLWREASGLCQKTVNEADSDLVQYSVRFSVWIQCTI